MGRLRNKILIPLVHYSYDVFTLRYETIRIIVDRMRSRISSMAASGNRANDGIKAMASSTIVSVATKFIRAETSAPCNSNSSPSSVSFRNVVKALVVKKKNLIASVRV